jgi:hypothetical protein
VGKRAECREVLEAEVAHWSEMHCEQLIEELHEEKVYQILVGLQRFQVEVELVEDTNDYLHVIVSVDDGVLLRSVFPVTSGFITKKHPA